MLRRTGSSVSHEDGDPIDLETLVDVELPEGPAAFAYLELYPEVLLYEILRLADGVPGHESVSLVEGEEQSFARGPVPEQPEIPGHQVVLDEGPDKAAG